MPQPPIDLADPLRSLERSRLHALVARDMPRAWTLHAPDSSCCAGAGQPSALGCWHTDTHERRDGAWQVVWSQATAIR